MENQYIEQMAEQEAANTQTGLSFELNNLINLDKSKMTAMVAQATNSVIDGDVDGIKSLVFAKKGLELFGQLEKAVRPIAEGQQRLSKSEVYKIYDSEITTSEQGVKYDFSVCDDKTWNELKDEATTAADLLKEREAFLKAVTKPMIWIDEESGETWNIKPPVKTGKVGLMIKIK